MKNIALFTFMFLCIYGCAKQFPCSDTNVQMIFTAFKPADLDTIVLRKFKPADNYLHLIDSINIFYDSSVFIRSNDTTVVFLNGAMQGIKAHYDWQIVIPAINRTVFISDIVSEQSSGTCGGVQACGCINKIYSLKIDNVLMDLSNLNQNFGPYHVYIHK